MDKEKQQLLQTDLPDKKPQIIRTSYLIAFFCVILVAAILLTFTLTSASMRRHYLGLIKDGGSGTETPSDSGSNLDILAQAVRKYSYYADNMSEEEMLKAAFNAYVLASGDRYAQYYSAKEYADLLAGSSGKYCGIGVTVLNTTTVHGGETYLAFQITNLVPGGPGENAGLAVNDRIIAIDIDGVMTTISSLGYDPAISAVRGEEGTSVKLWYLRGEEGAAELRDCTAIRANVTSQSVIGRVLTDQPTVGVVRITAFELYTPTQFKNCVEELKNQGVQKFVFDLRDNPGGNLLSIKAVLSYFLQEGDLVLQAIDKDGNVAQTHTVEPATYSGSSSECNVTKSEIGMYRDLNMVVLCNENTASAAEVFVATMRDYHLAEIVGKTTFGKGIMQTTQAIFFGNTVGYVKLTTHAYVTKCGVSYHGVGVVPQFEVSLPEAAKGYAVATLPFELDTQLQQATLLF